MATRPLLPLVVACAALAGCGDEGPSDEEQVRATLARFESATAAGDYAALCDRVLARRLVEAVEKTGLPCDEALGEGYEEVEQPRLTVGTIAIRGDTATAEVRSSAEGQAASDDTVELVREAGGWRIAALGPGATP